MEELMIVANVAIVFGVIYKLFELFAGRRERMMLIEKLGDKLTPETFKKGIVYRPSLFSFGGLRVGCLLLGIGVGLLVGYGLVYATQPEYFMEDPSRAVENTDVHLFFIYPNRCNILNSNRIFFVILLRG